MPPTPPLTSPFPAAVDQLLAGPRPLPIVSAGDPVLRRRAEPYDGSLSLDLLTELLAAMRESMLAAPGVDWPRRRSGSVCRSR